MTSVERAYAKINLHLDVTGKLSDGYHSVSTVMQSVSLYDSVTLSLNDTYKHTLSCNDCNVPTDSTNLALRAVRAFEEALGKRIGVHVDVDKQIPIAGGLAGGSTDAAAVLRGLNKLLNYPFDTPSLCKIGSSLGADVPFCVVGGSAYADGKGDILHPFPSMPHCVIVIASGGEGVSTPVAYSILDGIYDGFNNNVAKDMSSLLSGAKDSDVHAIATNLYNIFEAPVLSVRPVASSIKSTLLDSGALGAMMSGSGPSVFGIFENEQMALVAYEKLKLLGVKPHICTPVSI